MDNRRNTFCKGLLNEETVNPVLQENYRKELAKMFEEKISTSKKWWIGILALFRMAVGVALAWFAIFNPFSFPTYIRIVYLAIALFVFWLFGLNIWLIRRGSWNLKTHFNLAAWVKYGFLMALAVVLILLSPLQGGMAQILFMIIAVFLSVIATMVIIFNKVHQSELKTREKLLEIELALAKLTDKLSV